MPYEAKTISKPQNQEPASRGLGQAMREVKQMVPGESKLASVGGEKEILKQEEQLEVLSESETKDKAAIVALLLALVEPPLLSKKHPSPIADKVSFMEKVKGMTLPELRRFVPAGIEPQTIDASKASEDFKLEMQKKYKNLSP